MNTNSHSPWGRIEHAATIAVGITEVSTSSHGGFHLSPARAQTLRKSVNTDWKPFTGDWRWLEEDCDAAVAVCFWGEEFEPEDCFRARLIVRSTYPKMGPWLDSAATAASAARAAQYLAGRTALN